MTSQLQRRITHQIMLNGLKMQRMPPPTTIGGDVRRAAAMWSIESRRDYKDPDRRVRSLPRRSSRSEVACNAPDLIWHRSRRDARLGSARLYRPAECPDQLGRAFERGLD